MPKPVVDLDKELDHKTAETSDYSQGILEETYANDTVGFMDVGVPGHQYAIVRTADLGTKFASFKTIGFAPNFEMARFLAQAAAKMSYNTNESAANGSDKWRYFRHK